MLLIIVLYSYYITSYLIVARFCWKIYILEDIKKSDKFANLIIVEPSFIEVKSAQV